MTIRSRFASVVFDADSTLSAIEGIDWLGALRGERVGQVIRDLTDRAMMGELPLEQVYAARLDAIKPTRAEIERLSAAYIEAIEPGAAALIAMLQVAGAHVVIVSGGLRDALLPMAAVLGVPASSVMAVDLLFDEVGNYVSLRSAQPLSEQDGKPRVVQALKLARPSVMIGDGSTDALVKGHTDMFYAYTGVVRRSVIVAMADAEAQTFGELGALLLEHDGSSPLD